MFQRLMFGVKGRGVQGLPQPSGPSLAWLSPYALSHALQSKLVKSSTGQTGQMIVIKVNLGGLLVGREGRGCRLEDARQQELLVSEGLVGPAGTLPETKS